MDDVGTFSVSILSLIVSLLGFSYVLWKVAGVHTIVNSQRSEMMREIDRLKGVIGGLREDATRAEVRHRALLDDPALPRPRHRPEDKS